jgi:EAL domain-containing protein (putative c-di-GMP-specific phosphodiesterase class I)
MAKVISKLQAWSHQLLQQVELIAAQLNLSPHKQNNINNRGNILQRLFLIALGASAFAKLVAVTIVTSDSPLPIDPSILIVVSILGLALSYSASVHISGLTYCLIHWGLAVLVLIELKLLNTFSSGMLILSVVASVVLLKPPVGTIIAAILVIGFFSIWYVLEQVTPDSGFMTEFGVLTRQLKHSFLLSFTMIYTLFAMTIIVAQIDVDFFFALEQRARDIAIVGATVSKEFAMATEMYRFLPRHLLLLDANSTVILASTHFLAYTQLSEQELLGRQLDDVLDFKHCNTLADLPANSPGYLKLKPELGLISFRVARSELEGITLQQLIEITFDALPAISDSMIARPVYLHPSAGRESLKQRLTSEIQSGNSIDLAVLRLSLYDDLVSEYGQQRVEYAWQECLLQLHQMFGLPTFRINAQTATIDITASSNVPLETLVTSSDISAAIDAMTLSIDDMKWNLPFEVTLHQAPVDGSTVASIEQDRNLETEESRLIQKLHRQRLLDHMRNDGFLFHFQPVRHLATNDTLYYEGLARWTGLDPMSPPEFISLSQSMGLGFALTKMLFGVFCRDVKTMLKTLGTARFSFNMTLADVLHPDFQAMLLEHCANHTINRRQIILELTESENLDNREMVIRKLSQLKEAGFQIAIDDFGKAFSSLERIIALPLDYLKLDSLVMKDSDRPEIQVLLSHIVEMCHRINVTLIAEGIESSLQRDLLRTLGYNWGQGYLLAMPSMPIAWIHEGQRNDG